MHVHPAEVLTVPFRRRDLISLELSSMFQISEQLSKEEESRPQKIYDTELESHQVGIRKWLNELKCLLCFYQETGFTGNLGNLDASL
jgi:hypothetical protein